MPVDIIKARCRYIGETHDPSIYLNNSFHNIKIKQVGEGMVIIRDDDTTPNKESRIEYKSFADFMNKWDICSVYRITRIP